MLKWNVYSEDKKEKKTMGGSLSRGCLSQAIIKDSEVLFNTPKFSVDVQREATGTSMPLAHL